MSSFHTPSASQEFNCISLFWCITFNTLYSGEEAEEKPVEFHLIEQQKLQNAIEAMEVKLSSEMDELQDMMSAKDDVIAHLQREFAEQEEKWLARFEEKDAAFKAEMDKAIEEEREKHDKSLSEVLGFVKIPNSDILEASSSATLLSCLSFTSLPEITEDTDSENAIEDGLSSSQSRLIELVQEIVSLKSRLQTLEESENRISELIAENITKEDDGEDEAEPLEDAIKSLIVDLSDQKEQTESLMEEITSRDVKIQELEESATLADEKIASLQESLEDRSTEEEELAAQKDEHINILSEQCEELREEKKSLEEKLGASNDELETVQTEITKLLEVISEKDERLEDIQAEFDIVKESADKSATVLEETKSALEERDAELEVSKEELQALKADKEKDIARITKLEDGVKSLKEKAKEKFKKQETEIESLKGSLQTTNQDFEETRLKLVDSEERVQDLKEVVSGLEQSLDKTKKDLSATSERESLLHKKVLHLTEELQEKKEQVCRLQNQEAELVESVESFTNEVQTLTEMVQKYESKVEVLEEKYTDLVAENEQQAQELSESQALVESLQSLVSQELSSIKEDSDILKGETKTTFKRLNESYEHGIKALYDAVFGSEKMWKDAFAKLLEKVEQSERCHELMQNILYDLQAKLHDTESKLEKQRELTEAQSNLIDKFSSVSVKSAAVDQELRETLPELYGLAAKLEDTQDAEMRIEEESSIADIRQNLSARNQTLEENLSTLSTSFGTLVKKNNDKISGLCSDSERQMRLVYSLQSELRDLKSQNTTLKKDHSTQIKSIKSRLQECLQTGNVDDLGTMLNVVEQKCNLLLKCESEIRKFVEKTGSSVNPEDYESAEMLSSASFALFKKLSLISNKLFAITPANKIPVPENPIERLEQGVKKVLSVLENVPVAQPQDSAIDMPDRLKSTTELGEGSSKVEEQEDVASNATIQKTLNVEALTIKLAILSAELRRLRNAFVPMKSSYEHMKEKSLSQDAEITKLNNLIGERDDFVEKLAESANSLELKYKKQKAEYADAVYTLREELNVAKYIALEADNQMKILSVDNKIKEDTIHKLRALIDKA